MRNWLSMIPVSARVHRRQNRLTVWCITIAVFLVTAVFSMAEAAIRQETGRLVEKHGLEEVAALFTSDAFRSLLPIAVLLFLFVLFAGVFMIAGSLSSSVAQRTQLFGMMRCIGMSRRQVMRYVRLEALNWCKSAVPAGLLLGTAASWLLCAVLKYFVGGEWADMPQLGVSLFGVVSGVAAGVLTVLIAASRPARRAASVSPVSALGGADSGTASITVMPDAGGRIAVETALGIRHATRSKKNLLLMIGSFALSILLLLSFSVLIDLVDCLLPQSVSRADLEIQAADDELIDSGILSDIEAAGGVKRAFGRRAVFNVEASCEEAPSIRSVSVISFGSFDLEALKKDGILKRGSDLEKVKRGEGALVITEEELPKDSAFTVFGTQLPAVGSLKYDPFSSDGSTGGETTLIVSDEAFAKMSGVSDYTLILVQLSGEATDGDVETIRALTGDRYKWIDDRENDTRGTYLAFLVCAYGFLAIIALVTVLNVASSLSMSVSARMKQYGVMRAIGMSKKQLGRMIKAEALTCTVLGCAAGLLLGLPFSRWLYGVLVTAHFPYAHWSLPAGELIAVAAFFALAVVAGIRNPVRRLNEMSITETISRL